MKRTWASVRPASARISAAGLLAAAVCIAFAGTAMGAPSETIVISQVYGGGSNNGATYESDFIELFNRGTTPVSVSGWSVQYASATGTFSSSNLTALSGTIEPGHYYLVKEYTPTTGAQGAALPTADATGSINMSASAGKVALVNSTTPISSCAASSVVDLIGFGSANCFEGAVATGGNATTAMLRKNGGCTETDNNSADFTAGTPTPRNSSQTGSCGSSTPPSGTLVATPNSLAAGENLTLTVTVTPGTNPPSTGITVTGDLSALGVPGTTSFTAGANNIFTYQFNPLPCSVNNGTTSTDINIVVTIEDSGHRRGTAPATVTVKPGPTQFGPVIGGSTGQPQDTSASLGGTAKITVRAMGANLTYQWYRGTPTGDHTQLNNGDLDGRISGATSARLEIANMQASDEADYYVVVTGSCTTGSIASNPAHLYIDQSKVVISQIYGGAGCASQNCSYYKNDYIELFNKGTTPAVLPAWSVQYGSDTGTGNWQVAALPADVVIPAGGYYLVKCGGNANGTNDLPSADATVGLTLSATAGKVAVVKSMTALVGTVEPRPADVADLVGYGTSANAYEGTRAPNSGDNSHALFRLNGGCQDTNYNGRDFVALDAAPRSSASQPHTCDVLSCSLMASPNPVYAGATVMLTVTVSGGTPGYTVVGNLTAIGGSEEQAFLDDGANGDVSAGDNTFTFVANLGCSLNDTDLDEIPYTISATVTDAENSTSTSNGSMTVQSKKTQFGPVYSQTSNGKPKSTAVCEGATAEFNTRAMGPNLTYAWYQDVPNGTDILLVDGTRDGRVAGATTSQLQITGVQSSDAGDYYVVVTGSCTGSVSSDDELARLSMATGPVGDEGQVIISQVYGGGGNTGATYQNDFIELYNKATTPVNLYGWSVQYASDTGTDWSNKINLTGTIQPKRYYLVKAAAGTGCDDSACGIPLPGNQNSGNVNLSGSSGKVALVKSIESLTGDCPLSDCRLVDFVNYGATASCTNRAPNNSDNTKAWVRRDACNPQDTGDNSVDFEVIAVTPRNAQTPPCSPCNPAPWADSDKDQDVDQADFGAFQACFAGGAGDGYPCECFDRPGTTTGVVDQTDLEKFNQCAQDSGPSILWNQANTACQ